jgi:hypothetical protein
MTEPQTDSAATQEERAVHYEVEAAPVGTKSWRLYHTTKSLDDAREGAKLVMGIMNGTHARIRRVESARRVEVVETIGAGEG